MSCRHSGNSCWVCSALCSTDWNSLSSASSTSCVTGGWSAWQSPYLLARPTKVSILCLSDASKAVWPVLKTVLFKICRILCQILYGKATTLNDVCVCKNKANCTWARTPSQRVSLPIKSSECIRGFDFTSHKQPVSYDRLPWCDVWQGKGPMTTYWLQGASPAVVHEESKTGSKFTSPVRFTQTQSQQNAGAR